jgi:hypothetical protein
MGLTQPDHGHEVTVGVRQKQTKQRTEPEYRGNLGQAG